MFLDPRTKLLILAITSVSVFLNESMLIEGAFTFIPFLLLLEAKHIRLAFKSGAAFIILLALPMLLVPHLPVTAGGILYMFAVYIRKLIPCFMLGSLLIRTTKVSTFLAAISRLHLPKGFTIALSITLRYFPTMTEEWGFIKDAMSLRGISASPAGLLFHPVRTMEYVYVPMLVSASKISDEITQAAITRGIDHLERRSCLENIRFRMRDALLLILYSSLVVLIIFNTVKGAVLP
ncbi:energy-coupling factor transporter transmembrane component T family protein [Treponema denticola]|jgi:transporter, putative|uniref:energy-coupling factor transporter transmembrane component T family protein n=1 Tax=Treponema denticola TaxID=158 RepID=UPI0020A3AFB1|nr:energy-coupling factor transporter transmembrane component T [Treponema denticola]UTC86251.1 energy-coupling factor transporter transmembrane protein EcfT [Treponema denticola]